MSDVSPQTPELKPSLNTPLNPKYKRLGLPAIMFAWFIVIILFLTFLIGAFGIAIAISNTTLEAGLSAFVFGVIGLYLTYLHYKVVATAVNCDKQMYSLDPTFPQY